MRVCVSFPFSLELFHIFPFPFSAYRFVLSSTFAVLLRVCSSFVFVLYFYIHFRFFLCFCFDNSIFGLCCCAHTYKNKNKQLSSLSLSISIIDQSIDQPNNIAFKLHQQQKQQHLYKCIKNNNNNRSQQQQQQHSVDAPFQRLLHNLKWRPKKFIDNNNKSRR